MKLKTIATLLTMCAVMMSCSSDIENEPNNEMVTLTFSPYEMESMTRATSSIADYCTRLDVWITDGTTTQDIHQLSSQNDFGTVAVTLDKTKTYTLTAVAHKCTEAATLTNNVIAFTDGKLTHAMVYTSTFSPGTTTTLSCEMTRIVGMFRMETTDAVPSGCAKMRFVFNCNDQWNAATATSSHQQDKEVSIGITSTHDDGTVALSFYVMPDNLTTTKNIDIVATALTSSDAAIQQRTFTSVPIKAGYKTTYRGAFFTDQALTCTFTANDWSTFDTINF